MYTITILQYYISYEITHKKHITAYGTLLTNPSLNQKKEAAEKMQKRIIFTIY